MENAYGCTVAIQVTLFEIEHLCAFKISHHMGIEDSGNPWDCGGNVIRNMERQRCDDLQLPETLLGRHPEDFPPLVLPSTADLDTYVAMVADEEKVGGLTSNASVTNRSGRLNPQIGKCAADGHRCQRDRVVCLNALIYLALIEQCPSPSMALHY